MNPIHNLDSPDTGPHRSGDIATKMGKSVNAHAAVRCSLINIGVVCSTSRQDGLHRAVA